VKRAVALSVVITAILLGPGAGAQEVTSPEELLSRLGTAGSVATEGVVDPSPARMQAVQDALGLPVIVRIDGSDVSIPPDPVIARLSGGEAEDFRLAMERVEALRASLERAMAADPVDREDVETALTEAYRGVVQVDPGIVERIRRAIADAIQNVLTRLFSFSGAGTVFAWAVLLGLGVLVFLLIRRLRLVPETTMEAVRSGSGTARVDWVARAEGAVRAGDFHAAVHAFYRGLLATLSGRGLLIDAPGLTAGECRSTVRSARPELFDAVAEATGTFEQVAYGGAVPEADDVDTLRKAVALARSA
jgi:hypothetical protein